MEIGRGHVVLMNSPSELGRPRPGVVVQADEVSLDISTVFVCPITSHLQDDLPLRPVIEPDRSNGLRIRSQIMTDKMIALRRDRIRSVIGRIESPDIEQLDRALLIVLGLAR